MRRLVVLFCLFLLCIQEIYAQQQVSDELRAYNDYLLSLSCYKASGELNMAIVRSLWREILPEYAGCRQREKSY